MRGRLSAVVAHPAQVNGWSPEDAEVYLEAVFERWAARSRHQWTLDISLLSTRYGIDAADRAGPAGGTRTAWRSPGPEAR